MLTAKQAKNKTDEANASETNVLKYVSYLLSDVDAATARGEYFIEVARTRDDLVTSKAIQQLRDLGYTVDVSNELYIHISWE